MFHTILVPVTQYAGDQIDPQTVNVTLSDDILNLNLWDYLTAQGLTNYLKYNITIASGVVIGSSDASGYAFNTGGDFPSGRTLTITNNGSILGKGGIGGDYSTTSPGNGQDGGGAMNFTVDATVTNNGLIGGGGGGGGGGNTEYIYEGTPDTFTLRGSVGSGGAGYIAGRSGSYNGTTYTNQGGTYTAGGQAFGTGGAGGNLGAAGGNGQATGGAAGDAVHKNSNTVTITNNGTISGSVVA